MAKRPNVFIGVWSSNDLYPVGSQPWSSTPTKIIPASDEYRGGHVPEEQPVPMYWNYIEFAHSSWIKAADGYELRNWPVRQQGIAFDVNCGCWDQIHNVLYLGGAQTGDATVLVSSSGGVSTLRLTFGAGHGLADRVLDMAVDPARGDLCIVTTRPDIAAEGYSARIFTYDFSGATWREIDLVPNADGNTAAHAVKFDAFRSIWVIGGATNPLTGVNHEDAWYVQAGGGLATFHDLNLPSPFTHTRVCGLALGPPNMVLTDSINMWVSNDVDTDFVLNAFATTDCRGLEWNPTTATYLALDQINSTTVRVWGSVDGVTWTARATLNGTRVTSCPGVISTSDFGHDLPITNALRANGAAWAFCGTITSSSSQVVFYSIDNGSSWGFVPSPSVTETALIEADGGIGLVGSHPGAEATRYAAMLR